MPFVVCFVRKTGQSNSVIVVPVVGALVCRSNPTGRPVVQTTKQDGYCVLELSLSNSLLLGSKNFKHGGRMSFKTTSTE